MHFSAGAAAPYCWFVLGYEIYQQALSKTHTVCRLDLNSSNSVILNFLCVIWARHLTISCLSFPESKWRRRACLQPCVIFRTGQEVLAYAGMSVIIQPQRHGTALIPAPGKRYAEAAFHHAHAPKIPSEKDPELALHADSVSLIVQGRSREFLLHSMRSCWDTASPRWCPITAKSSPYASVFTLVKSAHQFCAFTEQ